MKPILLIFPGYKTKHLRIPFSIITLAAYLRKHGTAVEVLDTRLNDYKDVDFSKYLLVGLSVVIGDRIKVAYEISKYIKQKFPKTLVVWGGQLPSAYPGVVCDSGIVDVVVRKEGEETLLDLINSLNNRKPLKNVKGITFKKDGLIVSNPDRPFLNMKTIPPPAYDLIDLSKYCDSNNPIEMETSRGCPHKCKFCYSSFFNNQHWRAKPVKKVVDEIRYFTTEYSANHFFFLDSNFFVDKKRVLSLCDALIHEKISVKWSAHIRPDDLAGYSNKEIALMKNAGLNFLRMGAESGSQRILDVLEKDIKVGDIRTAVLKCAQQGVNLSLTFVIGAPGETSEDLKCTIKLCKQIKRIYPTAYIKEYRIIQLYPGSRLYNEYSPTTSFKNLEELAEYFPLIHIKWLRKNQLKKLITLAHITAFFYLRQLFRTQGKNFQKSVLGSTKNVLVWKLLLPLIYTDALLRWKTNFFYCGYEWPLLESITKKVFIGDVDQF
ncbi:MAG: radical SAM protein [Nanoarchaeota archaeon]|nr:radical SAM protein [Nanoarchaeota archaeon]